MSKSARTKDKPNGKRKERGADGFPHWALRMFFSVDMVGSTAYKHASLPTSPEPKRRRLASKPDLPGPHWLPTFAEFYSAFSEELDQAWQVGLRQVQAAGDRAIPIGQGKKPEFWKSAGDELLFHCLVTSPSHAGFCLDAFRLAIINYRAKLAKANRRLNLKATAWLAGFPVNNIEVVVGAEPDWLRELTPALADDHITRMLLRTRNKLNGSKNDSGQLEFIGPQMDLGFRLAAHATPRHMVISADLVYLLVENHLDSYGFQVNHYKTESASEAIRLDGSHPLKGILGGTPYPIFWIDCDPNELNKAEDRMLDPQRLGKGDIKDYCEAFFRACGERWMVRPFIWDQAAGKAVCGSEPEGHDEVRKGYCSYLEGRERALESKLADDSGGDRADRPEKISERLQAAASRGAKSEVGHPKGQGELPSGSPPSEE